MTKSLLWVATATLVSTSLMAADARGRFSTSNFALELDGADTSHVRSVEGGGASAEVVSITQGDGDTDQKQIGKAKYDDFSIKLGFDSGAGLLDWIKSNWNGDPVRKDGAVIAADFNYRARYRAEFYDALISEITFPACDATSRDPAYLAVKFSPEVSSFKKAGGQIKGDLNTRQKQWSPANFRIQIGNLECRRVLKVESFTIKQSIIEQVGEARDYDRMPGKLEYPNLTLRIAQADIDSWLAWYEDFIVKGNAGDDNEKTGTITLLSQNLRDEIASIDLRGVGLKRFTPFPAQGNEGVAWFEVELYVENMHLEFGKPVPQ